jgi:hypothetical protein
MIGILFFLILSRASDVGEKTTLRTLQSNEHRRASFLNQKTLKPSPYRKHPKVKALEPTGNLARGLLRPQGSSLTPVLNPVVRPKLGVRSHDIGAVVGDIFDCRIYQDIIGYVGSVSPVRAEILSGPYKGYYFVGNATMDASTKNIVVQFHKIRSADGQIVVNITATVHSSSGELGLKGTVTSHYWRYFFASVLSSAAEGYADATVQRQRNLFGNYENVPTAENAGKQGLAQGASQTADVMSEKMKSAPEFTTVRGPITTKIFIIDDVKM